MRLIEVKKCTKCPYRHYDNGGGMTEPWEYCTHPKTLNVHIKFTDIRSGGNFNVTYYDFPKWCKLKEK